MRASLPSRECGLKFGKSEKPLMRYKSLPSRECGLKYRKTSCLEENQCHSLRGSVDWNSYGGLCRGWSRVTPFAGVWIEIPIFGSPISCRYTSLPSRECGLKSTLAAIWFPLLAVTPFAGVWIEMWPEAARQCRAASLPSRECGLKFNVNEEWLRTGNVTPFAGVWIEIFSIMMWL